ncbi:hypothetical protein TWF481_008807 [Arthrobotrys musiformis]|uniref:Secreted protein n=1 Tax=Arthrobotrys musiformis TaxID=47236 RepID=A0AAV9W8A3_9PEZI
MRCLNCFLPTILISSINAATKSDTDPARSLPSLPAPEIFSERAVTCAPRSGCTYTDNRYCYFHLNARGGEKIVVGKEWTVLCVYGGCVWRGRGVSRTECFARDMARGGWESVLVCGGGGGAG